MLVVLYIFHLHKGEAFGKCLLLLSLLLLANLYPGFFYIHVIFTPGICMYIYINIYIYIYVYIYLLFFRRPIERSPEVLKSPLENGFL